MKQRYVVTALCAALTSAAPSVLYAQQQACETLIAVSYAKESATDLPPTAGARLSISNAELLQQLAQATQLQIQVQSASRQQAFADVRSGRVDLIIGTMSATQQHADLDYLTPVFARQTYRLWRRSAAQLSLEHWPELAGLRGVQVLKASLPADFAQQVQQHNWPMQSVADLDQAIDLILEGEADYLVAEQRMFEQHLAHRELTSHFEYNASAVATRGVLTALSKDSACNSASLRNTLNKALAQLDTAQ